MRELSPVIISVFWGHSLIQSLIHPFVTDQILALISWFTPLGVAHTFTRVNQHCMRLSGHVDWKAFVLGEGK